ncbi:hypothetical protein Q5P01_010704 [Channa striata]|uniref:Uncharacterized protein n=1 Tax=Channa striata TaxID=64152 RepID=A0AA88SM47_CHASR|nr:hypothetical protein Q5P01_010704 [Channa striata]
MVAHCQHGKPCAIACPSDKEDGASRWPGLVVEREVERRSNQGRESDDDKSRRDDRRPPEEPVPRGEQEAVHSDPRGHGSADGNPKRGHWVGPVQQSVLADEPCREECACKNDFVGEEAGRLFERENVNTNLVENALGYPLSKTLVLDPDVESDLKGTFFCKLQSTGRNDVVGVFLEARRDGTEGTTNNGNRESERQAVTRGPR